MNTRADIDLRNLHKAYGDLQALNGVDIEVSRGSIVGLIGPDGAGKTTLMRIACGLLLPDEGSAALTGFDSRRDYTKLKDVLGYMPQRFSLYPDLSVMENLRFFADLYLVERGDFKERSHFLLEFSRLE
ncbi:ATP-binding cassette domain-containing protein, partial [bacterium]|nr:ATP-binding cassette domain-containing protein [bacterium]